MIRQLLRRLEVSANRLFHQPWPDKGRERTVRDLHDRIGHCQNPLCDLKCDLGEGLRVGLDHGNRQGRVLGQADGYLQGQSEALRDEMLRLGLCPQCGRIPRVECHGHLGQTD